MKPNKYTVLVGTLSAQLTIAALYAWSILDIAIIEEYGWNDNEVFATYAIAQFVFAFSTLFSGKLIDRKGPRLNLIIGGVLFGGGLLLSSLATSPFFLYISYGVIAGAGVGFVYVTPLSTLLKWFPNNRGLITGLSVAVFGGGSILFKEIMIVLLRYNNVSSTFLYLGLISGGIILLGSLIVGLPEGYQVKHSTKTSHDYTTKEMVKTSTFKITWVMYLLAVVPGLLLLGAAKNIGLDNNLNVTAAANLVTILALSNASSRLVTGSLADKFGVLKVLRMIFIITILSLFTLSFLSHITLLLYISIIGIAIGYGGFLCLFPTWINKRFGSYRYGSNYGVIFQAYGIAALLGIFIKSVSGSYENTFIISAIAGIIGLILAFKLEENWPKKEIV